MAKRGSIAKSLDWTERSGAAITSIQSFDVMNEDENVETRLGDARVNSHFAGQINRALSVTITDLDEITNLSVGDIVTSLVLTVAGTRDSGGTAANDFTYTMSRAVVESIGNVTKENGAFDPLTVQVTFRLSRAADAVADPTAVWAEVT